MEELQIIDTKNSFAKKKTIVWNDKCEREKNILDVFDLIDDNKYEIRQKYLRWIHEIQNLKIHNNTIINHLKIDNNFSFWWMLPISEKSNFMKSFHINEILKLIALEEYIKKNKIKKIFTTNLNKTTNDVITYIARRNKIIFIKRNEKKIFSLDLGIVNFFKAFLWLFNYLYKIRFLFGLNLPKWDSTKNKICIVTFFFNINLNLIKQNIFSSSYFNSLIDKIHFKKMGINWLNIYFENEQMPNSKFAKSILSKINKIYSSDIHVTLDSFISVRIILLALKTWFKVFYKSLILTKEKIIQIDKSKYFLILSDEFTKNLQNHHSLKNILVYFLMKEAFGRISKQNSCIFINENQPWEMALLSNYFKNDHNNIIGYQHTTARFWDLRNYYYKKSYKKNSILISYPRPNHLAVHSKIFYNIFLKSNYPKKNLKMVEAVRYEKLIKKNLSNNKNIISGFDKDKINITIVLGAFNNFDQTLINCVQKNIINFDDNYCFFLKNQFSSDKSLAIQETNNFKNIQADLLDIFKVSDLVIISNPSSAVLDAMYMNIPFYVYDGGDFLNFSPMYSIINNKYFIRDYNFVSKLKSFKKNSSKKFWSFNKKNILNANLNVTKWKKLIKF
jgi:surface carbohydrate biosynthesis protein (TIGR04326 family)